MEKKVLHKGDRVRLTRDLPDVSVPHKAGEMGTVEQYGNEFGVRFDGQDSLSFKRDLDGKRVFVIDYCELVEASPTVEISAIPSSARYWGACGQCGKETELGETGLCPACLDKLVAPKAIYNPTWINPLFCYNCNKHGVDPETWECSECGANFANIAGGKHSDIRQPAKKLYMDVELSDKARQTISEIDEKLAALRPVRYEIKTLQQENMSREDAFDDADTELETHLNDGWEILNISASTLPKPNDHRIPSHHRYIILRRPVSVENFNYIPVDMGHSKFNYSAFSPLHVAAKKIYGEETDGDNG